MAVTRDVSIRTDSTTTLTELASTSRASIDRKIAISEAPTENLDDFYEAIETFNKKISKSLYFLSK